MKNYIKNVFWFYLLIFIILIGHILNFTLVESKNYIFSKYNPRYEIIMKDSDISG